MAIEEVAILRLQLVRPDGAAMGRGVARHRGEPLVGARKAECRVNVLDRADRVVFERRVRDRGEDVRGQGGGRVEQGGDEARIRRAGPGRAGRGRPRRGRARARGSGS